MPIIPPKNEGFERELIPAGNYIARCYRMLQIGTVESEYMGEKKILHRVRIGWELPLELKVFKPENGEQPLVIEKEYTLSMGDKATLRKDLASWRGKDFTPEQADSFDITTLIGVPCMLNIIHKQGTKDPSKTYQQISSITPLPKGMICPPLVNKTEVLSYDNFNWELYEKLPDFIKDQIKSTPEFSVISGNKDRKENPQPAGEEDDDDLPF